MDSHLEEAHSADAGGGRRAVVFGGSDLTRTIGRPGLLERAGAAEVARRSPNRFEVLQQQLTVAGTPVPDDVPASLRDWFATMLTSEAVSEGVGLVVMSLHHQLFSPPPWRHTASSLLVEPPRDFESVWTAEELDWLKDHCRPASDLDAAAAVAAMRTAIETLHSGDRTVLLLTVSTYDPSDMTISYDGVDDTYTSRAHRLIAAAQRIGLDTGMGLVDVDRAIAEIGAADHVPAAGDFDDTAAEFITEEAISSFDESALFDASMQPDIMRLVIPPYDRRTERGRVQVWHATPGSAITRGDDLLNIHFENMPLGLQPAEGERRRKKATRGSRQTRNRSMTVTVVAASDGYLYEILATDGDPIAVGDTVALVAPKRPSRPLAMSDAEGDFRVAVRRAERDGSQPPGGSE